jgi:hypothetical protein
MELPADWRDLSKGVKDIVHRVPAAAGDCIIVRAAHSRARASDPSASEPCLS